MPIYEYKCTACEHEFEALQKISENPLQTCPSCQQDTLKKKVSATAFRLSGSGWYETDFKSNNKKNLAGESDKAPSGTEKSGDAKGGEKSAAADSGKDNKSVATKKAESGTKESTKATTSEKSGKSKAE